MRVVRPYVYASTTDVPGGTTIFVLDGPSFPTRPKIEDEDENDAREPTNANLEQLTANSSFVILPTYRLP